jgi:hypothetical protein
MIEKYIQEIDEEEFLRNYDKYDFYSKSFRNWELIKKYNAESDDEKRI